MEWHINVLIKLQVGELKNTASKSELYFLSIPYYITMLCSIFDFNNMMIYLFWSPTKTINFFWFSWLIVAIVSLNIYGLCDSCVTHANYVTVYCYLTMCYIYGFCLVYNMMIYLFWSPTKTINFFWFSWLIGIKFGKSYHFSGSLTNIFYLPS
jgi:hypothetical protein